MMIQMLSDNKENMNADAQLNLIILSDSWNYLAQNVWQKSSCKCLLVACNVMTSALQLS